MNSVKKIICQLTNRLLRGFFYLLYHRFAWTYDFVAAAVSVGLWNDWVMSIVPLLNGPGVLELGHGPGHLQVALNDKGIHIFGIDLSREMNYQAYGNIQSEGGTPQLAIGNTRNLPFSSGSFHQVAATFPTEYIVAPQTLSEIWRVLKPGGSLFVLPAAWITGNGIFERLAALLFRVTGQSPDWDDNMLEPFGNFGFHAQAERLQLKSSSLIIIIAEKRASSGYEVVN